MTGYFDIAGPAGALEAMTTDTDTDRSQWAVLCHPHPQYGGSMHDAVLNVLSDVLLERGISVLRFNFRGVGQSEGIFDRGIGEVEDLKAAVSWLTSEKEPARMLLGGYSFGSNVAWRACQNGLHPDLLLLIAPPVGAMDFSGAGPGCPVHAFAGDLDEFIDSSQLDAWQGITIHQITGANHFFMGRWQELNDSLRVALDT